MAPPATLLTRAAQYFSDPAHEACASYMILLLDKSLFNMLPVPSQLDASFEPFIGDRKRSAFFLRLPSHKEKKAVHDINGNADFVAGALTSLNAARCCFAGHHQWCSCGSQICCFCNHMLGGSHL